ncbi:oxidoreductase [Agaricicola taiwanensis]|uniref:Oxidoreductase n=1 Tax=Agaricicola taiwanensis TaxID=591372 RepID=A0A8J2YJ81_9RHOB|nr:SDR family NAD(P)-dependent oxidoreductase [Agaricicola taiwanensis]GGE46986.1 oxidoreductase [Agaricicola taiwanensis]
MAEQRFLDGRVALVTGASRGIGYAVALEAARAGAHVIAVARTVGGLETLDDDIRKLGGSTTLVPLDLKDYAGIDRLGAAIFERWGRLDALVGNAGLLGPISPLGHIEPKSFDDVFAVNVTANWRLIRSLDPLFKRSDAARAVFVSSGASSSCKAYWGLYAASKAALEALVRSYAAETRNSAIRANLVNPGATRTKMRAQAMPGEDPATLPNPADIAPGIVRLLDPQFNETGRLYDAPRQRVLDFQPPA